MIGSTLAPPEVAEFCPLGHVVAVRDVAAFLREAHPVLVVRWLREHPSSRCRGCRTWLAAQQ